MGLRFRKRISLSKLLRVNLSGSGVSIGVGPPGLNLTIGPRGIRRTIGIPGTGVYYQDSSGRPKDALDAASQTAPPSGRLWPRLLLIGLVSLFFFPPITSLLLSRVDVPPNPTREATPNTFTSPAPAPPLAPDRALTRDEIRELQALLRRQGFVAGPADGIAGPRTRAAIAAYRQAKGLPGSDEPTQYLLEALRAR